MKRSGELIPTIINAKTKEEAIAVIKRTMELLNLNSSYLELYNIKNKLEEFEGKYRDIERQYRELPSPRTYEDIHNLRVELGFLSRDLSDELSFDINRLKIYWEECRTAIRGDVMLDLNEDAAFKEKVSKKKDSTSPVSMAALENMWGSSKTYKEYLNNYAMAYGMFKSLDAMMTSMNKTLDALSSEERYIMAILNKDVK